MLSLLVLLVVLAMPAGSDAEVIDPARRVDWRKAGVVGGVPHRTTVCATLRPGATAAAINAAIAACPGGQVVRLRPGTYYLSSGIVFKDKDNVTLRGAGPDRTFLVFTGGNRCGGLGGDVCFINGDANWSGDPRNVASWTDGYAAGAKSVTLSSKANLKVGSLIVLDQRDDALVDTGAVWVCQTINVCSQQEGAGNGRSNRAQTQIVRVTSISPGDCPCTIGITPGLYMPNWRASQQPQAWWSNSRPITGSGVEDLSMDHSSTGSGIKAGAFFFNAYNCWLSNVRGVNSKQKHVWMYQSAHLTIQDSYFYGTQDAASESYGTDQFIASDILVVNNIFQHIASPMMNEGATGSVYAYNYSVDDFYTAGGRAPAWQQSSSYHHAAGNAFILWEGNSGSGLMADDIHGTSHFVTAFRNYWTGRDIRSKTQQTIAVHLQAFNRYYNVVGNVLGTPGYHTRYQSAPASATSAGRDTNGNVSIYVLGYSGNEGTLWLGPPAIPNDPLTRLTLMRWGNYDTVHNAVRFADAEVPSGIGAYPNRVPPTRSLPPSLYRSAPPAWWPATIPWPAIGPDVTGGNVPGVGGHAHQIPAHACYVNVLRGATDGSSGLLTFNANDCYPRNGR